MYNEDVTLREKIRTFVQSKLDEAQGQALSFVLGKDFRQSEPEDGDPFIEILQIDGSYKVLSSEFTPVMFDRFSGTPEPVKDMKVITYTLPMTFLVTTVNKFTETKEALERFADSLRGADFIIDTYLFGTNAEEVTNTEAIQNLNGVEYVRFTTTIYVSATEDGMIGNFVKTYFGETEGSSSRIFPATRTSTRAFTENTTQWNADKETFTLLEESTWTTNLSFLVNKNNPVCIPLIQHLEEPQLLNKNWYYNKDYTASFGGSFAKEVCITSITMSDEIGEFALISLVLHRSGVNYGQ